MGDYASWDFQEGDEIHSGRSVLKALGGGNRYEVCLVWDDSLYALGVAKVLRPDQADDEKALRDLGREAEVLAELAHPSLVRGFDAVLDGQTMPCSRERRRRCAGRAPSSSPCSCSARFRSSGRRTPPA